MSRLYKFAITGFIVYAIATASPVHQAEIGRGLLAVKDAAVEACTRANSPCTLAVDYARAAVGSVLSDQPAPWMDDAQNRPHSQSQLTASPPPAQQ